MKELKRCPHCGNRPEMKISSDYFDNLIITVECPLRCPLPSKFGVAMSSLFRGGIPFDEFMKNADDVINNWNERMSEYEGTETMSVLRKTTDYKGFNVAE